MVFGRAFGFKVLSLFGDLFRKFNLVGMCVYFFNFYSYDVQKLLFSVAISKHVFFGIGTKQ